MRVAVVAEFYPRAADPVLGIWAHRQTVAVRDAGVDLTVFVLHRLVPPAAGFNARELGTLLAQPAVEHRDGIPVHYVRYVSPPRRPTYASWGAWAAPALGIALRRAGPFDLIHAHNAIPAGDAARRARLPARPPLWRLPPPRAHAPLVISVHGGDVLWTSSRVPGGAQAVRRTLSAAQLVLANSQGILELALAHGATRARVVRLGTDLPAADAPRGRQADRPLLVTAGHLVARKRHADVLHALARLPGVDYLVIGDGPDRPALEALVDRLGLADRVELAGQLDPSATLRRIREADIFVMPSTQEAFGVAYIEAMAAGIPAIGAQGEPGPEEIGPGIVLVPACDPPALAAELDRLLRDPPARAALGVAARENIAQNFTWQVSARATLAAYDDAVR